MTDLKEKKGEFSPNESHSSDFQPDDRRLEVMERAERLKRAVGRQNTIVASRAGIHVSTLNNYLAGRDMKASAMIALAEACGVSIDWLATGRGPMQPQREDEGEDTSPGVGLPAPVSTSRGAKSSMDLQVSLPGGQVFVPIPRYNIEASAGGGRLLDNPQIVEYMAFSEDFLRHTLHRRPHQLLLVLATGDSMEPTIRDKEIVIVDLKPRQRIESGAVHVVALGENLLVKRLEARMDGTVIVHSDNPRYDREIIPPDQVDELQIIGHVIWQLGPARSSPVVRAA